MVRVGVRSRGLVRGDVRAGGVQRLLELLIRVSQLALVDVGQLPLLLAVGDARLAELGLQRADLGPDTVAVGEGPLQRGQLGGGCIDLLVARGDELLELAARLARRCELLPQLVGRAELLLERGELEPQILLLLLLLVLELADLLERLREGEGQGLGFGVTGQAEGEGQGSIFSGALVYCVAAKMSSNFFLSDASSASGQHDSSCSGLGSGAGFSRLLLLRVRVRGRVQQTPPAQG